MPGRLHFKSEDGAGLVEFALLVTLIALVAIPGDPIHRSGGVYDVEPGGFSHPSSHELDGQLNKTS